MTEPRKLKKSESLEIRIPYPTKQAFMDRCRREGRSASEALRAYIDSQLDPAPVKPVRRSRRTLHLLAGAVIAAAVGAAAVPSLARDLILKTEFHQMDADRNGQVSFDEFRRAQEAPATVR